MDSETLKIARALPLFSSLSDDDLDCLSSAEIVNYREGDIVVENGAPAEHFYVSIEGEVSLYRLYDEQEILMGVARPGVFMGEIFILLDMPWITGRVTTPQAKLLRMKSEDFWRMLESAKLFCARSCAYPRPGFVIWRGFLFNARNLSRLDQWRQDLPMN